MQTTSAAKMQNTCGIFSRQGQLFALDSRHVREFVETRDLELTLIPRAPACLAGILNLRGEVLPVILPDRFLGLSDRHYEKGKPVIRIRHETLNLGLQVDSLRAVAAIPPENLAPHPLARHSDIFSGTFVLPGFGAIDLINLQHLLERVITKTNFDL